MMNNKGKEKDKHGDSNQEKWFAFPYCGKEVKYVTKLFKGTHVKIAYKISNILGKILTYKTWAQTINLTEVIFTCSWVQIVGRNTLHSLADYSARAV